MSELADLVEVEGAGAVGDDGRTGDGAELADLVEDIRVHGLRQPNLAGHKNYQR